MRRARDIKKMATIKQVSTLLQSDTTSLDIIWQNLELILSKKEAILSNLNHYALYIFGTGIFALYANYPRLYLGDFVRLWTQHSNWHLNGLYTYALCGSPLSGMNICKGYNTTLRKYERHQKESFNILAHEAQKVVQTRPFYLGENLPQLNLCGNTAKETFCKSDKKLSELVEKLKAL